MSDEVLKKMDEILDKVTEIEAFISKRDRVKNAEYCKLRGITRRTLDNWFSKPIKPCPREDDRHVSIKAVDEWLRTQNTRHPKKKP